MGMGQDIDYSQFILQLEKAVANGVPTLDSNTKIPKSQISLTASDVGAIATETDPTVATFTKGLTSNNSILTALNAASGTISASVLPSYVDDFLTFPNLAAFPVTGETGKIYLAENANLSYRWSGSSYVDISSAGTADQAVKLATPRTISTTGDATYSVSFDGSANVSAAITLANSGVPAGTYNALATQVRPFTVDSKGRITGVGTAVNITPPWSSVTSKPSPITFLENNQTPPNWNYWLFGNAYGANWELIPATQGGTNNSIALRSATGGLAGTTLNATATTPSTSPTTGASIVAGGQGIAGDLYVGGSVNDVSIKSGANSDKNSIKIGDLAGFNAIGTSFIAIGKESAWTNGTGNCWTSIGVGSGNSNMSGDNWVALGFYAGRHNLGSNWVAIGTEAGRFQTDGSSSLANSPNSCYVGHKTRGVNNSTNENVFGYNAAGKGSNTVTLGDSNITASYLRGNIFINDVQLISSSRRTGWGAPTGTPSRTTFATSTVTLPQLAERVKALIDDLTAHGLIGA